MNLKFNDGRDWFFKKRFGMFIHWGLYSINGWHEQMQFIKKMPRSNYSPLLSEFNPVSFDPDKWLDLAEETGMDYLCFTTKHIDGFCMFDTKYSDYNIMRTPYGRDVLKMLSDACRRRNFPLCLYYSVVDMHHPNYSSQGRAYELPEPEEGDDPNIEKYMDYIKKQINELCTNYGEIHGIWWDCGNIQNITDPTINDSIRLLQPNAVINDRGFDKGDFGTPERDWYDYTNTEESFQKPTEACQSIGTESWGYRINEDYYSGRHLIQSIDKILAKGGKYLLNVGPKADGTMPEEAKGILNEIGTWFHAVKPSFDDTRTITSMVDNKDILLTGKENKLYVHANKLPESNCIWLKPLKVLPIKAVLLNSGQCVHAKVEATPSLYNGSDNPDGLLRLSGLPVDRYSNEVMVIELEFDRPVRNTLMPE